MIDIKTATSMVEAFIATVPPRSGNDPWVVIQDETEDFGFAWVFNWMARSLVKRESPPITGIYPIIVQKEDGQMFMCTGPYRPQFYVDVLRTRPEEMSGRRISVPPNHALG